jgi:hypothetical protein
MLCSYVILHYNNPISTQKETFEANYMNLVPDWILPKSAKRLDNNEDEKMSFWRVIIMSQKKDEFILKARSEMRY